MIMFVNLGGGYRAAAGGTILNLLVGSCIVSMIRGVAVLEHSTGGDVDTVLPVIYGPVVNGIDISDPGLGSQQPLVELGFLDVTKPPFNADPTGIRDATEALQNAISFGRRKYLVIGFPPGKYMVNATLSLIQLPKMFRTTVGTPYCNNMHETYGGAVTNRTHCGRTAPAVIKGLSSMIPGVLAALNMTRARIVLAKDTNLKGPVVLINNPLNDNINMNQVLSGVDIEIESGNPDAIGVSARGAQGVSVQDVTIFAGDGAIGLQGGAGSGGSHIGVTVVGGQIGIDVSSSQPAPTLTAITLIGQIQTALAYRNPGRQTLSVVGLNVTTTISSAIAIVANFPMSIYDAIFESKVVAGAEDTIAISTTSNIFLRNAYFKGYSHLVSGNSSGSIGPVESPSKWTNIGWFVSGADDADLWINGSKVGTKLLNKSLSAGPTDDVVSQHMVPSSPIPGTKGVCNVKDPQFGAKGDFLTDDTEAIQRALSNPSCFSVFLPKGYYAVTKTLYTPTSASVSGVSRIYSNIVPHSSVWWHASSDSPSWPLVETAGCSNSSVAFDGLSILIWHHLNSTYALHWKSRTGSWRESHINRVDLSPGLVGPAAYYNQPLMIMDENGGGNFWNFYQENWDHQGPLYRHLLVRNTDRPIRFYQLNTEHSQGEANTEFTNVSGPVRVFGFKGEGNYVQIWFRNASDVLLLGYGGNASPFPYNCTYPPGYAPFRPSLLRVENCDTIVLVNLISQSGKNTIRKCGLFNTGFAGSFYDPSVWVSVFETIPGEGNFSSAPGRNPVAYVRGNLQDSKI